MDNNGDDSQFVVSYLTLRRAVGFMGFLLPVILPLGVFLLHFLSLGTEDDVLQESEDHETREHGTVMVGVFVGVLFSIGVFLYSYVGYPPEPDKKAYELSDNFAGNLACLFFLGVALFPTTHEVGWIRAVHSWSAAGLFLTLAYFSLVLFTKDDGDPTPRKLTRNKYYTTFGLIMLACIALIAIYKNTPLENNTDIAKIEPVFWLESIALWAFSFSWAIKGNTLFKDDPISPDDGQESEGLAET